VAEESNRTESPSEREALERRLDRLEQEYLKENRWWRGGLIGALVLVAVAILAGGFHRRPPYPMGFGPMAMQGPMAMAGPMGYPPPPPPNWGYGGCDHRGCPGEWHGRPWGGPGAGAPDGGPGAGPSGPPPSSNG